MDQALMRPMFTCWLPGLEFDSTPEISSSIVIRQDFLDLVDLWPKKYRLVPWACTIALNVHRSDLIFQSILDKSETENRQEPEQERNFNLVKNSAFCSKSRLHEARISLTVCDRVKYGPWSIVLHRWTALFVTPITVHKPRRTKNCNHILKPNADMPWAILEENQ